MFNSVALEVVIGLVFIYLLYSLLATVLSELIATMLGLRARNLKEAIDRMLNDEKETGFFYRLWDSMKLMKNPNNKIINAFYNHPEIKYLGSSGIFKTPSSVKAVSFSKTLMNLLFGNDPVNKEIIENRIQGIIKNAEGTNEEAKEIIKLDPESAYYIHSLWYQSQGDIAKFKLQLEGWFDRTMEQTTVWYKRKIQIVLLVLGFCLAWFFYADTFVIIKNLSTDKDARDKLVSMANAYVQNNQISVDTSKIKNAAELSYFNERLDSLLVLKKQLEADIAKASSILGLGGWLPDTAKVVTDLKTRERIYTPQLDAASLSRDDKQVSNGKIGFSCREKLCYLFRLFYHHFFGFLITAIAISLGAPFWFDLLNKVVKLRTSKKEETDSTTKTTVANTQPITVNINNQAGEDAVS
jgi:hypothetical protein